MPTIKHSTVTSFLAEVNKPGVIFDQFNGDRPNIWSYIHGPGHHKAVTLQLVECYLQLKYLAQ